MKMLKSELHLKNLAKTSGLIYLMQRLLRLSKQSLLEIKARKLILGFKGVKYCHCLKGKNR